MKDFFGKCDQICSFLWIWSNLPKKSLMKKFIFCKVKVTKQLFWNHTSAWVFSYKFATYFHNTFPLEHLWRAASELNISCDRYSELKQD